MRTVRPLVLVHSVALQGDTEQANIASKIAIIVFIFSANVMRHAFSEGRSRPFRNRVDAVVLPLSSLTIATSSSVETRAPIEGTSRGDVSVRTGASANVRPSFRRIRTLPDTSALSSTLESFCRASEYV